MVRSLGCRLVFHMTPTPNQEGKPEKEKLWAVGSDKYGRLDCRLEFDTDDETNIGHFIRTVLFD